jgi:NADPH:quinone reductase-like Zn-dependent oxidoreductase
VKAIVQDRFGPPEVLELREIDQPEPGDDEVLVRVHAASVNPADWYAMTGTPYLARPQMGLRRPRTRLGLDLAGVVEAVGGNVARLKPGDEVFGACSTRNVEMATSLGADRVIDYTREDFTQGDGRYDLLFDVAGSRPWAACRRVLHPRATLVLVGAPKGNRLLGPLDHIGKIRLASLRASQKVVFFISKRRNEDLVALQRLLEAGTVTPVVERAYPLRETAHAFRHLGEGHARGKLVVTV